MRMDLYLVRHAAAFDPDETRWPDDRDRPLTRQGEKRFRRAARGLVSLTSTVDVVLSSSYRRARPTAELLEQGGWAQPRGCEPPQARGGPPAQRLARPHKTGSAALAPVWHAAN